MAGLVLAIEDYSLLTAGTYLVLPDNFVLEGIGDISSGKSFVNIGNKAGRFNVSGRFINSRTLNISALCAPNGYDRTLNLTYISNELMPFIEKCRTYLSSNPLSKGLRLYYDTDKFFFIDAFEVNHNFEDFTCGNISNFSISLTAADPMVYSDLISEVDIVANAGADVEDELSFNVSNTPAFSSACYPIIEIYPDDGIDCSAIDLKFYNELKDNYFTGSYCDNRMVGTSTSKEVGVRIDAWSGLVLFTNDSWTTKYNVSRFYYGSYPIFFNGITSFFYIGNSAKLDVYWRNNCFA